MVKMTVFYEPGIDSNMRLQDAEDKDLTLDALENAEKINPGDTDDLYGIFDGKLENENYNALANHYKLHGASNEELQSKWIELMGERFDLDSQHTSDYSEIVGTHAPDPLCNSISNEL